MSGPTASAQRASIRCSAIFSLNFGLRDCSFCKISDKALNPMAFIKYAYFCAFTSILCGCGYVFQGARTPNILTEELGIRKIYLATPKNLTYKPGVEVLIYNEVQRAFKSGNRIELVREPNLADAVLEGEIVNASFIPNSLTSSQSIFPVRQKTIEVTVATEFLATLIVSFRLVKPDPNIPYGSKLADNERPKNTVLWGTQIARSSRFLGNNQKGEFGSTSALINASEFDRTIQDSSRLVSQELHDSLLVMF